MSGARLVLLALPAASGALLVNAPSAGVQVARPVKTALAVEQIEEQLERGRMVLGRTRDMPLVALTKKNNPGILTRDMPLVALTKKNNPGILLSGGFIADLVISGTILAAGSGSAEHCRPTAGRRGRALEWTG